MIDWLRSLVIQPSAGVRVTRGPSGTSLAIMPKPGSRASEVKIFPLKIADVSTDEDGVRIRIYNGRLGGLLPSEMSLGDDPHYYLYLGTGTSYIVGQISVSSNGTFSGASVYNNGSAGLPQANGSTVYLLIGRVVVATSSGQPAIQSITQEAAGNQGLVVFASANGNLLQPMWVPQETHDSMYTDATDCPLSTIELTSEVDFEHETPSRFTQTVVGTATFVWQRVTLASLVAKPGLPVSFLPTVPEGKFAVVRSATLQADYQILIGPQSQIANAYVGRTVFHGFFEGLLPHEYTYHATYGGGGFSLSETAPGRYTLYTTAPATPTGNEAHVASRNQKTVELKLDEGGNVIGLAFGGSVALVSVADPQTGRPAVYRVTVPEDAAEGVPTGVAGNGHDDVSFTVNGTKYEYNSEWLTFLAGSALGGDGLQGWMWHFSALNWDTDENGERSYPLFFTDFERRSVTEFDVAVADGVTLSAVETAYIEGVIGRPKSLASFSVGAIGVPYPDPNPDEGEEPQMLEPPGWFMLQMSIQAEVDQFNLSGSWNDDAQDYQPDPVGEDAFRLTLTLS